ncbi:HD domain-containing protein [Candidatus Parcubacteria bacterium]|nr:HD domain-containing protein [Candidatus Parcubacteria bacterium]
MNERDASEPKSGVAATDYEALHAEALALNHQTFLARAETEPSHEFAEDLRFAAEVASQISDSGGLALVVGGYARDEAMARETGRPQTSKDIDMEVYGLEFEVLAAKLRDLGQLDLVGASFGIAKLKNPATGSVMDFSIPRTDSKVGAGHKGFQVSGDPTMSIREAARRRDLTINALALNPLTGEMIDEYGGLQDIKDGVLRATDPELFGDDPLRALRVVQFAGRFNFAVEPSTAELCRGLDLSELSRERIGEEWLKLITKSERPSVGLEVAKNLGILDKLHPELAGLDQIEQEPEWHPEGNVWNHTKNAADAAARVVREEGLEGDEALVVLFGALCHDLGKATTTELREKRGVMRITAHGHEAAGVEPTKQFLEGIKLGRDVINKVLPIVREHLYHVHNPEPSDKQLQKFAQRLQPANIRLWDLVSRCDSNGRGGEFVPQTASYKLYERSLELKVAERPAAPIVNGRDLIAELDMAPGREFTPILNYLYDAQLGGEFTTAEEGIAYYRQHKESIDSFVQEQLDQTSKPKGKTRRR